MPQIKKDGIVYNVSAKTNKVHGDLVQLILDSESIHPTEEDSKQYWFTLLNKNGMSDSEINRLKDILETEKKNLQALSDKYEPQIQAGWARRLTK